MLTDDGLLEARIKLRTKYNPQGTYTPDELYKILTDIYMYVKLHCSVVPVVQDSQQFIRYRDIQDS